MKTFFSFYGGIIATAWYWWIRLVLGNERDGASNDRHFEFGAKCATAVRESKTHRDLITKIFALRREYADIYSQSLVSNKVFPDWRRNQAQSMLRQE